MTQVPNPTDWAYYNVRSDYVHNYSKSTDPNRHLTLSTVHHTLNQMPLNNTELSTLLKDIPRHLHGETTIERPVESEKESPKTHPIQVGVSKLYRLNKVHVVSEDHPNPADVHSILKNDLNQVGISYKSKRTPEVDYDSYVGRKAPRPPIDLLYTEPSKKKSRFV